MELSLMEIKSRVREAKNRSEVLRLKEDIGKFMESPQFKQLSESAKEYVIELLAEIYAKEEQYKGCNPWHSIPRH